MKKILLIIITECCSLLGGSVYAQEVTSPEKKIIQLQHGAHRLGRRNDADMARWRAYGLGQFIHWGLYSIPAGEWNGKMYNGAAEWIRTWKEVSPQAYDSLIYRFNPTKFNPDSWAAVAKQMGVKYVTITTKHHDGFCLWPSKFTDFTVANSPYKKDIIGPLVKAYDKQGIDVILYFSVMDWHNPDWRYDIKTRDDSIAFNRFKQFTRNQLLELLTQYPSAKGLWFDGTWDKSWVKQAAFADSLETEMRKLHPGLIIGSRFRADEYGKRHFDSNGNLMGDYEQGWERKIPEKITDVHGNDWDCVMTIPENQWGYAKTWQGHIKTADELLEMLAKCVSLDGNFVLNFGPKPDGTLRAEELSLAKAIGDWMTVNKEAIYNGEYAGFIKQDWGYFIKSTASNKIYMLVFNIPVSGVLRVATPSHMAIRKAYGLDNAASNYTSEEIGSSTYFIHPNQQITPKKPFVIVLETGEEAKGQTGGYEKAKT
ncbi:alpha-L-fucosidase [Mucilaginibacter gossypiicola]|uniref:alpha-L-fucosidase n=1 Tax=Mucilaginibacter gossypiicola TaxID=551995 RepID=A0A1H8TXS3_9SPHI|nr:alpha-L-fucosidase [Mucilaginibacter gossypiicola]SEO95343.1 alpha-L-fucosidase [Mucilaginibacter gossypiicola]